MKKQPQPKALAALPDLKEKKVQPIVIDGGEPAIVVTQSLATEEAKVFANEAETFFKENIMGYSKVNSRYLALGKKLVHVPTKTVWEVAKKLNGVVCVKKVGANHIRRELKALVLEESYKEPIFS